MVKLMNWINLMIGVGLGRFPGPVRVFVGFETKTGIRGRHNRSVSCEGENNSFSC